MLEFAANGELYRQLAKKGRFGEKRASRVCVFLDLTLHQLIISVCLASCRCIAVSTFQTNHPSRYQARKSIVGNRWRGENRRFRLERTCT